MYMYVYACFSSTCIHMQIRVGTFLVGVDEYSILDRYTPTSSTSHCSYVHMFIYSYALYKYLSTHDISRLLYADSEHM
jgi:hypothetical protein